MNKNKIIERIKEQKIFREMILSADRGTCRNLSCKSIDRACIQPHHIIYKGHKDVAAKVGIDWNGLENGIALCPECHFFAHNGINNKNMTNIEFMLVVVLQPYFDNPQYRDERFRWHNVYNHLKEKLSIEYEFKKGIENEKD